VILQFGEDPSTDFSPYHLQFKDFLPQRFYSRLARLLSTPLAFFKYRGQTYFSFQNSIKEIVQTPFCAHPLFPILIQQHDQFFFSLSPSAVDVVAGLLLPSLFIFFCAEAATKAIRYV